MITIRSVSCAVGLSAVLFVGLQAVSWAQSTATLPTPVPPYDASASISSHYGPRIHPKTTISAEKPQFHNGIDYPGSLTAAVEAVEAGQITDIDYQKLGGWFIAIKGSTSTFEYLHLFSDDFQRLQGGVYSQATFVAVPGESFPVPVQLLDLSFTFPSLPRPCFAIVFRQAGDVAGTSPPTKVLTTQECAGVSLQGTAVQAQVGASEIIAAVGQSGSATGPHVHLLANSGAENPLNYVVHPQGSYTVTNSTTPGGNLKFTVNFATGMDLGTFSTTEVAVPTGGPGSGFGAFVTIGGPAHQPPSAICPPCDSITATPGGGDNPPWLSDGESLGILPTSQAGLISFVVPFLAFSDTLICDTASLGTQGTACAAAAKALGSDAHDNPPFVIILTAWPFDVFADCDLQSCGVYVLNPGP